MSIAGRLSPRRQTALPLPKLYVEVFLQVREDFQEKSRDSLRLYK